MILVTRNLEMQNHSEIDPYPEIVLSVVCLSVDLSICLYVCSTREVTVTHTLAHTPERERERVCVCVC